MRALGWAWLYIFAVLSSYYILRPIRDDMGVAGGVENLQWLFTGTLLGMVALNPGFAALV
jgi:AAA family ATP:ADP antiporter